MEIKPININSKEYLDFIEEKASVYNTPEWISLYQKDCIVMGVHENNTLIAVFNTFVFKKAKLQFFIPPPFMPDCALVTVNKVDPKQITAAITNYIEDQSLKIKYSLMRFSLSYKYLDAFESLNLKGFQKKWNHTYVLDISKTNDVQSLYAAKRRQQIRRAIKDGLQVQQIFDMNLVFDLVKKTFERQGKSINEDFIKKIVFNYANEKNSYAFASVLNSQYSVVYFCIHHHDEAFYLLGGYDEKNKHIGAGPMAMNACIEHAKKIGITTFDFEGSMEPNIEKYFKEFGGIKKIYLCYEKISRLGKLIMKIKKLTKS